MAKEKPQKSTKEEKKAIKEHAGHEVAVPSRLYELFKKSVVSGMMNKFHYKNIMQVPKLERIAINVGVGKATQDPKMIEAVVKDMEAIVGQKVVITRARKDISNFKLRQGMPIGVRVTLRRHYMYEFLDRFINITVPRIRDFRGFSDKSFDGRGNYTIGIKEHIIFSEIDVDKVTKVFGMDISFVTTAKTDQEAYELLWGLGMPFVKRQESLEQQSAS